MTARANGLLAALRLVLAATPLATADDVPTIVSDAGRLLGAGETVFYVIDYDQELLVPVTVGHEPALVPPSVEGTVAGVVYTEVTPLMIGPTGAGPTGAGGSTTAWVPVVDGTDRLGVLRLEFDAATDTDAGRQSELIDFAAQVAALVVSRTQVGDMIERSRRRLHMSLEAEVQWKLLPPLSFVSPTVAVSGVLIPTNEVAGDSFDYAVNGGTLHVAMVDAMGHGMDATLMSVVAVGAFRNARRTGLDLLDTARSIDRHVAAQFGPGGFVTGVLGELDTATGVWRWLTAGHPPALLVRGGQVVKILDQVIDPPFGLGWEPRELAEERLEPGDRLLLYTDGVVEARDAAGAFFGTERLVEFVTREAAAGKPAAETLRRLTHAILAHQEGHLQDDATTVLVQWPGMAAERFPPA